MTMRTMMSTRAQTTTPDPPVEDTRFDTWPDLQFWYGLSFTELWHMPRALRKKYEIALPRLKAEKQAQEIDAATFPHMKPEAQRSMINRLEIRLGRFEHSERPRDDREMSARAGAAKIGIQFVDADGNPVEAPASEPAEEPTIIELSKS